VPQRVGEDGTPLDVGRTGDDGQLVGDTPLPVPVNGQAGVPYSQVYADYTSQAHAALDETFEVVSLTFHDATVKTIDLPRDGWVETPLVYAVLRAKNAAVDRIPSIQIDMDFVDQPGQVVLPVMSQLQPIDAKDDSVAPRPCAELALNLTMDEREWNDGKVVVEIQARGQGIIPTLDELFDTEREGFDLEAVDGRMSVSEFVSDGSSRTPRADRNWQLTYTRKKDLRGDVMFRFPTIKEGIRPASVEYKHYQDADLVAVDADQVAAGVKLGSQVGNGVRNVAILAVLAALAAGLILLVRRKTTKGPVDKDALALPEKIDPFTSAAFLRHIERNHASRLGEEKLSELRKQIGEIESGYFSDGEAPELDLANIMKKWLKAAG